MVISVIYATNISSAGVHLAKFTPFCLISIKLPRKKIVHVALGVHLHPLHPLATPLVVILGVIWIRIRGFIF